VGGGVGCQGGHGDGERGEGAVVCISDAFLFWGPRVCWIAEWLQLRMCGCESVCEFLVSSWSHHYGTDETAAVLPISQVVVDRWVGCCCCLLPVSPGDTCGWCMWFVLDV
jgi:hypothetical protein